MHLECPTTDDQDTKLITAQMQGITNNNKIKLAGLRLRL